jgi:hypothetical protein
MHPPFFVVDLFVSSTSNKPLSSVNTKKIYMALEPKASKLLFAEFINHSNYLFPNIYYMEAHYFPEHT